MNTFMPKESEYNIYKKIKDFFTNNRETYFKDIEYTINRCEIKAPKTEIEEVNYYFKDTLKEYIKAQYENVGLDIQEGQINIIKGKIFEQFMDEYFKNSGWTKIEGEIGRNGIDGLYVRRDKNGELKVLIVESKYNTSKLSDTQHGKQMSQEWINKKLEDLINKNPDNELYKEIYEKVQEGKYRTRMFTGKEMGGNLEVSIKNIDNCTGNEIKIEDLKGNEKYKISGSKIDLNNPENNYQEKMADIYNKIKEKTVEEHIKAKQLENHQN